MSIVEIQSSTDALGEKLRSYAHTVLVIVFGLLPIFFIPSQLAPFEYSKVLWVFGGVTVALILYSLSLLRSGSLRITLSYPLLGLWAVGMITLISSVLSGDFRDAFIGDFFSIHGSLFVIAIALVASIWALFDVSKTSVMRLYILLASSALTLVVYHIIRLIMGPDALTFSVFVNATTSLVGNWNDLALFFGLSIILSLIALEQLPLTRSGRILFGIVTACALGMLGVINFFTVWLVLGLTSLALIIYTLTKDRMQGRQLSLMRNATLNTTSLLVSLVVFVVSVFFIVGGSSLGGAISKLTGVSYIEVRPSLEATMNIARQVYADHPLLGIGPNKFVDAWRLYKEQSINTTVFWNTDFVAGNGYISTFFVTSGILGGIAWFAFIILFLIAGIRMLLKASDSDRMWYFIGISSFVSAVYIWGMSLVYVPGAVMLMLGALCTGLTLAACHVLTTNAVYTYTIPTNRRTGFILTLAVIVVIIGSVTALYGMARHYAAAYTFNKSILTFQQTGSIDASEPLVINAYSLGQSDAFARRVAEFQLARLNGMLQIANPTAEDQERFLSTMVNGVNAAEQAVRADTSESGNWAILGGLYSVRQGANIAGTYEKAVEALTKARDLNPKNPIPYLELAILDVRAGKYETARAYAEQAVALKPDFTDALFYLSQIDIVTGNVDGAISSTRSIAGIEPQNPARFYQLGVLYLSKNDLGNAAQSFEKAIALDQNYSNARYFLALVYDAQGNAEGARAQLERVLELNPGNVEVSGLIETLKAGKRLTGTDVPPPDNQPVPNATNDVQVENGTVTTQKAPETPLVAPVNTAPSSSEGQTGGE